MNDRLKFRVWDKHINEYCNIQNLFILPTGETGYFIADGSHPHQRKFMHQEDMIIEMSTGLKDKNGNLIYEGDIVSNGYKTGVVKYGEFNCSCCDGVYGWYFDGADIRDVESYEIIGNIHEQPEQKE